jgi:maltose O-acetyltransferase
MKRKFALLLYYLFAKRFPTQPVPGWKFGYTLRRKLVSIFAEKCGRNAIIKQNAYLGSALGLKLGNNTQIGANSRIGPHVTLGNDVVMGPDVVLMTTSHAFDDLNLPIRLQGSLAIRPIVVEDDVWLGTRVVVLPGVCIGKGSVIGANSLVTKNVPPYSVWGGIPAKHIRYRGKNTNSQTISDPSHQNKL